MHDVIKEYICLSETRITRHRRQVHDFRRTLARTKGAECLSSFVLDPQMVGAGRRARSITLFERLLFTVLMLVLMFMLLLIFLLFLRLK